MRTRDVVAGSLLFIIFCTACQEARGNAAEAPRRRLVQDTAWRVAWRARDALTQVNARAPLRAAMDARRIYVVDPGAGVLAALNAADGSLLWATNDRDTATALRRPHDVAVTRGGQVVVADMTRRALMVFDTTGTFRRTIPLSPPVYSMCAMGESVLMLTWSLKQPIWHLDLATGALTKSDLPWPELAGAMPDKTAGSLQGTDRHDACVFSRDSGDGFAVWRDGAFGPARPFIDEAAGGSKRPAASGSLVGDEVWVTFGGGKAAGDRRQIIDIYDAATGRYRKSIKTPNALLWLTHRDGRFVAVATEPESRSVIALTPTRTP